MKFNYKDQLEKDLEFWSAQMDWSIESYKINKKLKLEDEEYYINDQLLNFNGIMRNLKYYAEEMTR